MSEFEILKELDSQLEQTRYLLNKYGKIDQKTAIKKCDNYRVSDDIYKLRKFENMDIESKKIKTKNRFGKITEPTIYILKKDSMQRTMSQT